MFAKQALIDLGIVLIAPILVIGGYILWGGGGDAILLSEAPTATIGPNEPGAKTKLALDTLKGINFDDSLFRDEAFTSLTSFTVTIPEVPLSRSNPFTPPAIVEALLRQARLGASAGKSTLSTSPTSVNTPNLSSKINALKQTISPK